MVALNNNSVVLEMIDCCVFRGRGTISIASIFADKARFLLDPLNAQSIPLHFEGRDTFYASS